MFSDRHQELSMLQKHIESWEEKVKLEFPLPAAGHLKLDFYCFPGTSTADLFQKIFHLEPITSVNEQRYTTSILAILHT